MPAGDEDEVLDESTEGQGTEGQDGGEQGNEPEADLSAEQSDGEADDGESEGVDEPRRSSRSETRIQRLANEAKAAREEAAATRRELSELRRTQQQPRQMTEQEERERLALMTADERTEYRLGKAEQNFAVNAARLQFQVENQMDLTNFKATLRDNPKLARFQEDVERIFEEQKARGMFVSRDVILDTVIGRAARASAAGGTRKAKEAGARRVAAQQVRPGNARGDAAPQRERQGSTAEGRLKDVYI